MNCIYCSAENPDNANFCSKCGCKITSVEDDIINLENNNYTKKKILKIIFTVIAALLLLFIGFYIGIKDNLKLHEKNLEKDKAAIESELSNNSGTKIDDSLSTAQKSYYLFSNMCDLYITNDTLAEEQAHDLTLKLYILHDEVQHNILDNENTLLKYDNNNILNDFYDKLLDELNDLTNGMESFIDSMKEKAPTQSEIDQFFDDLHYFEDLFIRTSDVDSSNQ